MSLGPVMAGIQGLTLEASDKELLMHPTVGGVILFSRNYDNREQLRELVNAIHALRDPHLIVAVDQEGGRVQRFHDGFTKLPPAAVFGRIHDEQPARARRLAETTGWLMATELLAVGIDISFAPVLDLDRGVSQVIGDRAFHARPSVVAELALAYMRGMKNAGMAATGKHFPGHGAVEADSHLAIAVDTREYQDIAQEDLVPFERLIHNGLAAMMPAHVIYNKVDTLPAGFSPFWIREVARRRLGFQGVIFSDDLEMEGASVAGDVVDRGHAALEAGCDMVLVCNSPDNISRVVEGLRYQDDPASHLRLVRMHGRIDMLDQDLAENPRWLQAVEAITELHHP